MRVSACLLLLTICAWPSYGQEGATTHQSGQDWSLPPAILSMLGKEAREAMPDLLRYPEDKPLPDQHIVTKMLTEINQAADSASRSMSGAEALKEPNQGVGIAFDLGGSMIPNRVVGLGVVLFGKIVTGQAGLIMEREGERLSKEHERAAENIVRAAVAQANEDTRQKWLTTSIDTPEAHASAINELMGDQNDFFNAHALAGLPEGARLELLDARDGMLKAALVRYAKMNDTERAAESQSVRNELQAQRRQIEDLAFLKEEIPIQLDAMSHIMETRLESVEVELGLINDQVGAIQSQMWRGMDERGRLSALKNGFMPNMPDAKRKEMIGDLSKTVSIMNRRDELNSKLQTVGQIGTALAQMGVPIDAVNLQKNVNTASVAINVISSIAMGNMFGAFTGASGLFGGGGGQDAADAAIHQKLDQVIKLQKQTLVKLDELSKQIQASTDLLLSKLDNIDQKVTTILALMRDQSFVNPLNSCRIFSEDARNKGMIDGQYPSYEARAEHFRDDNTGLGHRHYQACRSFIESLRLIHPEGRDIGSPGVLSPFFAEANITAPKDVTLDDKGNPIGLEPLYEMMVNATWKAIPPDADAACRDHLLAVLSDAPSRLSSGQAVFACPGTSATARELMSGLGRKILADKALEVYYSPLIIKSLIGYMQFVGPFDDLAVTSGTDAELIPIADIIQNGLVSDPDKDNAVWTRYYMDHLNVSVAQQTVLSGYYAIPAVVEVLRRESFGHKPSSYLPTNRPTVDHRCPGRPGEFPLETHLGWSCLLAENPYFLSNTIRYLVVKALQQSGSSLNDYNKALSDMDPGNITGVLPGLPIRIPPGSDKWSIGMRDASAKPWDIPLPSRAEIAADVVAYRVGSQEVIDLRDEMMRRLVMQSEQVSDLVRDEDGLLLRRAMIDDPSLSAAKLVQ